MIEVSEMQLKDAVDFQPAIGLKKGEEYAFIEMAAVDGITKTVVAPYRKIFDGSGGAKFGPNDILFARIEPCLDNKKICKVAETGFGSTEFFVLRVKKDIADQDYIYYFVKTHYVVQSAINSYVGASGRQRADLGFIKRLPISLPPLPIQQKIAAILSAYDELIENNNQRIKLLEQMAEEIYKEWFVRLRFPGYEAVKVVDGLPEGWAWKKIKEFGKVVTGKTPSTSREEYFGGDIPFIKTPDMHGEIFILQTQETLTDKGKDSQKSQTLPENSIIINCIGALSGSVAITTKTCQTNQQINGVILNSNYYREFLFFRLRDLKPYILQLGNTGATMTNVSKGKFENIDIVHPCKNVIVNFHGFVSPMFEEIRTLSQKNQLLQQTRDLLLPRLISGKLSVEHLLQPNPYSQQEQALSVAAEPAAVYSEKNRTIDT